MKALLLLALLASACESPRTARTLARIDKHLDLVERQQDILLQWSAYGVWTNGMNMGIERVGWKPDRGETTK